MDLLQKCKQIYEAIRYFTYGIPVDGKIQDVSGEEFAKNYRFLSPQEFVDLEGGVCWDYVEYERTCCENHGLKYHQYYIITDTPPNYDTHTFITVEDGDELIYIESSFKKVEHIIDGVKKFKSLEEIVNLITTTMFSCNDNDKHFEEFKYDVMEYHGHPAYGCTCEEYMKWMDENGEMALQGTAINPKNIDADELAVEEFAVNKVDTKFTQFVCESANDPEEYDETLHDHIKDEDDIYNESWTDFKNGVHPSSGLMFHVSLKNDMDGKTINPQLPSYITDGGKLDDNYQEDTKTKRLCVSPSIEGCLIAILNYNKIREHVGDKFYVYTPEKPFSQYKHKTNKEIVKDKLVFDANITKEAWILEPCKLKLYGIIKLKKVKDLKKKPTVEKNIKMNTIKLDYEWIMTPKASGKFNKAIGDSPDKEDTKEKPIKEYDNILVSNEEFFGLSMIQESHKNITKHSFKSLTKKGIAVDNNSETGKLVKKVIDNVLKNHSLPSIKLNPSGFGVAKETDTFFYGYPRYIDGEIPTSKGKQLRFMAQINCKELKSLPDYPHTGLLQFWVHGDSEILDGPVKVIYIEKPNKNNIANVSLDEALYSYDDPGDFPRIDIKGYNHSDNLLFKSTTKETIGPNITDLEVLYKIFSEEYKKLTGKKADISALDDYIWDDDRLQPSWGNRVGGYPSSTQETSSKRTKSWNTMLLQLESIDREVYWGDFGIAAFYISHDDLIKRDFSKVGFDWDCY